MTHPVQQTTKLGAGELSALRAQHYPTPLDDYGRPWYYGAIDQRNAEIERLTNWLKLIHDDLADSDASLTARKLRAALAGNPAGVLNG